MNELFKLLSEYPEVLTFLIALATLTWAFYIVAFVWILIKGGEASLWPPGIKSNDEGRRKFSANENRGCHAGYAIRERTVLQERATWKTA